MNIYDRQQMKFISADAATKTPKSRDVIIIINAHAYTFNLAPEDSAMLRNSNNAKIVHVDCSKMSLLFLPTFGVSVEILKLHADWLESQLYHLHKCTSMKFCSRSLKACAYNTVQWVAFDGPAKNLPNDQLQFNTNGIRRPMTSIRSTIHVCRKSQIEFHELQRRPASGDHPIYFV